MRKRIEGKEHGMNLKKPSGAAGSPVSGKRPFYLRGLTLAVCAVLLLSLCSLKASAFEIDTSKFQDIQDGIDGTTIYYWYKGAPPQGQSRYGYPVLVVWDDKYYWNLGQGFLDHVDDTSIRIRGTKQLADDVPGNFWGPPKGDIDWKDGYYAGVISHSVIWGDSYYDYKDGYPPAYYRYTNYVSSSGSLLSQLTNLDVETLKSKGTAVSLECPEVPEMIPAGYTQDSNKRPRYAFRGYDKPASRDFYVIGYAEMKSYVDEDLFGVDYDQISYLNWQLMVLEEGSTFWVNGVPTLEKEVSKKVWQVYPADEYDNVYIYGAQGFVWNDISRISHRWSFWKDVEKMRDRTTNHHYMVHSGDKIGDRGYQSKAPGNGTFKIYYADPKLLAYLNGNFTVESGQVTSLDGPVLLPRNCTITVRDGGVLSVTGWIINNGTIKVEAGGTLLVQEDAAITTWESASGLHAGRIGCDGIMIVSSNGKVHCGGIDGLQFGQGAACINYGTLIAENFSVSSDYTIENRGSQSRVFAGWGSSESGYGLLTTSITGDSYPGKGTQEKQFNVNLPTGAVYGAGAGRVYVNGRATVSGNSLSGSACARMNGTDPKQDIQPAPEERTE